MDSISFVLIYFEKIYFYFSFIKTFFIYILEWLNPIVESMLYENVVDVNGI